MISKLDYCNSMLNGAPKTTTDKQDVLARSGVNKDFSHKDQDQDKDLWNIDQDKDLWNKGQDKDKD